MYSQCFSILMKLFQWQPWLSSGQSQCNQIRRSEKSTSFISKTQQKQTHFLFAYLPNSLTQLFSARSQTFQDWWPFHSSDTLAALHSPSTLHWSPQHSSKTVAESLRNGLTCNTISLCKEWVIRLHGWTN